MDADGYVDKQGKQGTMADCWGERSIFGARRGRGATWRLSRVGNLTSTTMYLHLLLSTSRRLWKISSKFTSVRDHTVPSVHFCALAVTGCSRVVHNTAPNTASLSPRYPAFFSWTHLSALISKGFALVLFDKPVRNLGFENIRVWASRKSS